jgi:hypothetical protein
VTYPSTHKPMPALARAVPAVDPTVVGPPPRCRRDSARFAVPLAGEFLAQRDLRGRPWRRRIVVLPPDPTDAGVTAVKRGAFCHAYDLLDTATGELLARMTRPWAVMRLRTRWTVHDVPPPAPVGDTPPGGTAAADRTPDGSADPDADAVSPGGVIGRVRTRGWSLLGRTGWQVRGSGAPLDVAGGFLRDTVKVAGIPVAKMSVHDERATVTSTEPSDPAAAAPTVDFRLIAALLVAAMTISIVRHSDTD